jgi:hypothetical protein
VPTESDLYEIEVLDGEVVTTPRLRLEPPRGERLPGRAGQPGVQAAVAMATGFVAGAATMALLRRYGQARLEAPATAAALERPRPGQSRTYLVQVRQIG